MERSSEPSKAVGASGLEPGAAADLDLGAEKRAEFTNTLNGVGTVASDAAGVTSRLSGRGQNRAVEPRVASNVERNTEGVPAETEAPVTAPITVGGRIERAKLAWTGAPRPARIALAVSAGIVLVSVVVLTIQGILSLGEDEVEESAVVRLPTPAAPAPASLSPEPVANPRERAAPPSVPEAPSSPDDGVAARAATRRDLESPSEVADRRRARVAPSRPAESVTRARAAARPTAGEPAQPSDPDDVLPIIER